MILNYKIKILAFLISLMILVSAANFAKAQPPSAITNLDCVFSGMPGAVWLTWTPPAGANSYDVRYALSPIIPDNYYLAYQYPQNWPGSANKGLVEHLTENKNWFFAMKAIDGGIPSEISNVVWCFVPIIIVQKDTTPPTSLITDPKDGATILASKDYIIKGESSDTGGSSVQKVEISFDDSKTWFLVKPIEENKNRGFSWSFVWSNPKVGSYTIKTRATDWWDNQEIPGPGIKLIVITELPIEKPLEKPISEMSVKELEAKIIEIQKKIIQLLTQLIQLIQSQITQFQRP